MATIRYFIIIILDNKQSLVVGSEQKEKYKMRKKQKNLMEIVSPTFEKDRVQTDKTVSVNREKKNKFIDLIKEMNLINQNANSEEKQQIRLKLSNING